LPQSDLTPLPVLLDRHWAGLLALLLLIATPLLLMTLGPWSELQPHRRQDHPLLRHRMVVAPLHRRQR